MSELEEKIARLPMWARDHIKRLAALAEPNNVQFTSLERRLTSANEKIKRLENRVEAMTEIFACAGRGGSETAQAYVNRIVDGYIAPDETPEGE